ncbi:signal transduction histidine kinase [Idiomarina aquatica]|uniref:histidine kinase n=1 Tax=Idiomarina aquatica TaxID=1327752 RepID=A0A4R6P542_9GAMM|nr:hypothetical protein [Idiomarina aquatica]TDP32651.1 signal transduction histidine kinase [Idiomarina aquatica]
MAIAFVAIAVIGFSFALSQSAQQTVDNRQLHLFETCGAIQSEIQQLFPNEEETQTRVNNPELFQQQLTRVLSSQEGIEGGLWHLDSGFFGYTFPSYRGSDIKRDTPETERTLLAALSLRAIEQGGLVESVQRDNNMAVLAVACPITTHEGLSAWLIQRSSLVPTASTITNVILFALLAIGGVVMYLKSLAFERRWYLERDKLVKQGDDETQPVPVTSNINEVQPLLMLLYQARQKNINLEQTIAALEAKLARTSDLSAVARIAASFAKELSKRLEQTKNNFLALSTEQQRIDQLNHVAAELDRINTLVVCYENLDLAAPSSQGYERENLADWLDHIANYHQDHTAKDTQTITAVCTEQLALHSHLLLIRFALDTLIGHAATFGPDRGEILIKAGSTDDKTITVEVIDEHNGLSAQQERRVFRDDDVLPEAYGQGLKLVRDTLAIIHATVSYESDGENSRFILQIPMTSE